MILEDKIRLIAEMLGFDYATIQLMPDNHYWIELQRNNIRILHSIKARDFTDKIILNYVLPEMIRSIGNKAVGLD